MARWYEQFPRLCAACFAILLLPALTAESAVSMITPPPTKIPSIDQPPKSSSETAILRGKQALVVQGRAPDTTNSSSSRSWCLLSHFQQVCALVLLTILIWANGGATASGPQAVYWGPSPTYLQCQGYAPLADLSSGATTNSPTLYPTPY